VQLKNAAAVDVMNIIVTITVGVKRAQSASKCTVLKAKVQKFLWGCFIGSEESLLHAHAGSWHAPSVANVRDDRLRTISTTVSGVL